MKKLILGLVFLTMGTCFATTYYEEQKVAGNWTVKQVDDHVILGKKVYNKYTGEFSDTNNWAITSFELTIEKTALQDRIKEIDAMLVDVLAEEAKITPQE